MIELEKIWKAAAATGMNLYDLAVISPDLSASHQFCPCSNCHNGYSVAKVFTMTAIGLLSDDGRLHVSDPIGKYFDLPKSPWRNVTIDHLLTHRSGIDAPFLDIDCDDVAAYPTDDYLSLVFAQPLPYAPGTHMQYSDAVFYLLSRIVSCISKQPLDAFLQARLFRPMRFGETAWSRCPFDYSMGGTGLYARAEDMAKLAWLYVCNGLWEGKRLLSAQWVQQALKHGYELHHFGATGWVGKGGMYGQGMAFSSKKKLAIAWHSFEVNEHEETFINQLNQIFESFPQ